jgi:uncharacterized protein YhdP
MKLISRKEKLHPALSCLIEEPSMITGDFGLKGAMWTKARPEDLANALKGKFDFQANNGRIHHSNALIKIFEILSVTDTFIGKIPDIAKEGFGYEAIRIRGGLEKKLISLKEAVIDTPSFEIIGRGDIDLAHKKMDLTILVAYFRALTSVIKHTPVAKSVINGKLLALPFRVTGNLTNPKVIPLSPKVVGSELLGIMERIFKLPYDIIQPVLQKDRKDQNLR